MLTPLLALMLAAGPASRPAGVTVVEVDALGVSVPVPAGMRVRVGRDGLEVGDPRPRQFPLRVILVRTEAGALGQAVPGPDAAAVREAAVNAARNVQVKGGQVRELGFIGDEALTLYGRPAHRARFTIRVEEEDESISVLGSYTVVGTNDGLILLAAFADAGRPEDLHRAERIIGRIEVRPRVVERRTKTDPMDKMPELSL